MARIVGAADAVQGPVVRDRILDRGQLRPPTRAMAAALFAAAWRRSTSPAAGWCGRATPCSRSRFRPARTAAGIQEFGPAGAAISSSPTIDIKRECALRRHRQFCDGHRAVADRCRRRLRLADGKLRWVKQLAARMQDRSAAAFRVPRYCGPWRPAIKFYWRDKSPAWSTGLIPITAARSCGRPKSPSVRGGVAWGRRRGSPQSVCRRFRAAGADPAIRHRGV